MNKELSTITEEWMKLERKTMEQRKLADEFYDQHLMKLIEADFIERNKDMVFEDVRYLIVSVGTSYEPIVLNIRLLHPDRIMFLYTEKSEKTLNKIIDYCGIKPDSYDKNRVDEVDPLDVYRVIKEAYLRWNRPERMYIDFTGGTKAMSASAALAGVMIDVQLVYVGSEDYLVDFRKPNPGSETLVYIDNPLAVFGDLEIDKAFELFDKYNFSGAVEKLEKLKESIPEPDLRQQISFVYSMAKAYEAWDALDFRRAYEYMDELKRQLLRDRRTHRTFLMMDFLKRIERQTEILEKLQCIPALIRNKKNMEILKETSIIHALMFTMYQNAMTREQQEKYDMATLLLYRLLEMIEQRRLSHCNLYVSGMDYMNTRYDMRRLPELKGKSQVERLEWLKEEVASIRSDLFRKEGSTWLADQVSLLDGFVILRALRDPMVPDVNYLKRIRSMVFLRNNSIFAHGLGPVSKGDYEKFRDFVVILFKSFCDIEKVDFRTMEIDTTYLKPMQSKYYTGGKE